MKVTIIGTIEGVKFGTLSVGDAFRAVDDGCYYVKCSSLESDNVNAFCINPFANARFRIDDRCVPVNAELIISE